MVQVQVGLRLGSGVRENSIVQYIIEQHSTV